MRTLDRYVVRNFLLSALLWLLVLMSIRIVADLFLYFDEFTESDPTLAQGVTAILTYYGYQSLAYFAELGGVILVAAAAFTLAVMNHTNELTAMIASGVSLHRVVWPVVICAILMGGAVVIDQELLIPRVADKLTRDPDDVMGKKPFPVRLIMDGQGTVWYSPRYDPAGGVMDSPQLILRDQAFRQVGGIWGSRARPAPLDGQTGWRIDDGTLGRVIHDGKAWIHRPTSKRVYTTVGPLDLGRGAEASAAAPVSGKDPYYDLTISAAELVTDPSKPGGGQLRDARFTFRDGRRVLCTFVAPLATWARDESRQEHWRLEGAWLFYPSDLKGGDLVLRQSGSEWMQYMSSAQLERLLKMERAPNPQRARLVRHTRLTDPLSNLVMLLLALPFILSRERNIKSSASMCVGMVGMYYAFVYLCRYVVPTPALAAWLPILVFAPVAALMLDSVKT